MNARRRYARECAKRPGRVWRLSCEPHGRQRERYAAENIGQFDELVVDHWMHLEKMDVRSWWMQVGEREFWIVVNEDGTVTVTETTEEGPRFEK